MELNERGGVQFFTSKLITVPHGFATRVGGVSEPPFDTLNLGSSAIDGAVTENYLRFAKAIGVPRESLVFTKQVHGDNIVWAENRGKDDCDGLITRQKGLTLTILWADCVPILLQGDGCVAAVHAGWRGTALGIVKKTVKMMSGNIRAAIGPAIGKCCFEVQSDVARHFPKSEKSDGEHWKVDLKAINRDQLLSAGVTEIDISEECTHCNEKLFFSHRRTGNPRGTQAAVIMYE
ncbi:laccase domain protein [Clostridia bacterium]|nr:laccase domain protein [Clostridia bacterium]